MQINQSIHGGNKKKLALGILIVITVIFLNALGPYFQLQKVTTYGLIPILFFIAVKCNFEYPFPHKSEFLIIVCIFLASVVSVFIYVDYNQLITGFTRQFSVILVAFIPLALNYKTDYFNYFHAGFILAILILIYIMYISGQFNLENFAIEQVQRDKFLVNANTYSYLMFFANFSLFYLYQKYHNKLLLILLIIIPVLFVLVSFVTQSRSGMLILIISNVIYWFAINKIDNPTTLQKLLRKIGLILTFVVLANQFWQKYEGSSIKNRFDVTANRVDARELLVIEAFDIFTKNIVFGVGLDQIPNYTSIRQFSHNSYVEILAEQGIIGGVLLLLLFGIPMRKCIIRLIKNPKNSELKLSTLFLVMFYFYNIFYPFYKFGFSMLYFFLVLSIIYKEKDSNSSHVSYNTIKKLNSTNS